MGGGEEVAGQDGESPKRFEGKGKRDRLPLQTAGYTERALWKVKKI